LSGAARRLLKKELLGLSAPELAAVVAALGERSFRVAQLMRWIYGAAAHDFAAMSDLAAHLRAKLANDCRILAPAPDPLLHDPAGDTAKAGIALDDGERVECVRIGGTVCLSSQVGCRHGCAFCRTGAGGFRRDLTAGEILAQWLLFRRLEPERRLERVVFMGMGEPLDNLDAVLAAIALLTDPAACGLSARRITVSTVGLPPGIDRLAALGFKGNLAVSLHAPTNALRDRIVPANRKWPIETVLAAAERLFARTGRRVTYEYVLLSGVNDGRKTALELARLLSGTGCHVNLIRMNDYPGSPHRPTDAAGARLFRDTLVERGVNVTLRASRGGPILAACGQLAAGRKEGEAR